MYQQSILKLEVNIKNYERIKRINKGGFATIYKVKDKKSGEFYAAKIIDCGDNQEECEKIIDREVGILFRAKHPTIIKFIGYSKLDIHEENNVTIIMELATNGSLSDILKKIQESDGPKYYNNTIRQIILIGISRGMKYLHDRNIIHRDLKPGNILLDSNYHPLITDFGLSKIFEKGHSYSQSQIVGTLPYMAPELFREKKYNRKADVYSFGILMFEVVTDMPAYPDLENDKITDHEFRCRVMDDNYRPIFKYPIKESIRKLIEKCWSNEPSERPNFTEIFNDLTNLNEDGSDNEDENCILEDVDFEDLNLYIEEINEVMDNTDQLLNKIDELKKKNKLLKSENEQKDDEINQLEHKIKQLKRTLTRFRQVEDEDKEEIQKLEQNLEQMSNKIQKMKKNEKQMNKEIEELNQDKEQMDNEIQKMKKNEKQMNKEIQKLKLDKEQMSNEIQKLKQNEEQKNKEIQRLKKRNQITNSDTKPVEIEYNISESEEDSSDSDDSSKKTKKIIPIEKDDLNRNYSISDFNCLPLKLQQNILRNINKSSLGNTEAFLDEVIKLIQFLLKLDNLRDLTEVLEFCCPNCNLDQVDDKCQIYLKFTAIESLIKNGCFKSTEFIDILKSIKQICFMIKYPSESFDNDYEKVVDFCKSNQLKKVVSIGVFISGIKETDYKFENDSKINCVILDYTITSIIGILKTYSKGSFYLCSSLTQVTIPSSVTQIGPCSFQGTSLTQVTIPSSVIYIGGCAFCDCSSLEQVSFLNPSSVTSFGISSFKRCKSLKQISIPSTVTSVDNAAFCECSSLTQASIPSSVHSIDGTAFYSCLKLDKIKIYPNKEVRIKYFEDTFLIKKSNPEIDNFDILIKAKPSIINANIPQFIKIIGRSAFYECSSLSQITIPSSVTEIDDWAFIKCSSLEQISIPPSVTRIGEYAFEGCSSLTKFSISSPATYIADWAFKGCSSLAQVTIPSSANSHFLSIPSTANITTI